MENYHGHIPDNLYIDNKGTGVREFRVSNLKRYQVTDWESFNGAHGKSGIRVLGENLTLEQANELAETFGKAHPGSLVNTMEPPYEGGSVFIRSDSPSFDIAMALPEGGIEALVNRFLAWKLPKDFNPDGGITFEPLGNAGSPHEYKHDPIGTNLLTAYQAQQMIEHLLFGAKPPTESTAVPSPR